MRPWTLDEIVGQDALVGPEGPLRALIEQDRIRSIVLWGPAGTGKTTLAHIIGDRTHAPVEKLSAISAGVADVRKVIAKARTQGRTILFLDEIHRFNKSQQDAFLGAVEDGIIVLIGATTENPFFEVNAPLMSRSLLFRLLPLSVEAIRTLLERALTDARGLPDVSADPEALNLIAERASGDARLAYNALELAAELAGARGGSITVADAEVGLEQRFVRYDKAGTRHYDVISAFIKSMRGSDPDAALYWLTEMLEGGEDPRFICRRMIIFASEDIGMADPHALLVAVATAQALEHVGLPEARYNLVHGTIYLASAPKSKAVKDAMRAAQEDVLARGREVPMHLRDSQFAYRAAGEKIVATGFRPAEVEGHRYYEPPR
jgi:putative ATPase